MGGSVNKLQEAFNKSWLGMKSQHWEKSASGGACKYRHPDGKRRCAVGWLMPDKNYSETLEGSGVDAEIMEACGFDSSDLELKRMLEDLQNAHDCEFTPTSRQERFRYVAEQYGLTIPGEGQGT
jgi:hypothetical protein